MLKSHNLDNRTPYLICKTFKCDFFMSRFVSGPKLWLSFKIIRMLQTQTIWYTNLDLWFPVSTTKTTELDCCSDKSDTLDWWDSINKPSFGAGKTVLQAYFCCCFDSCYLFRVVRSWLLMMPIFPFFHSSLNQIMNNQLTTQEHNLKSATCMSHLRISACC